MHYWGFQRTSPITSIVRNNPSASHISGVAYRLYAERTFLSRFTPARMNYELQVAQSLNHRLPFIAPSVLVDAFDYLDSVDYTTPSPPTSSADSAETFTSFGNAVDVLRNYADASHVWRNAARQRIMYSEYFAFTYISHRIPEDCRLIAAQYLKQPSTLQVEDLGWLARLTIRVANQLDLGQRVEADSANYFASSMLPPTTYRGPRPPKGLRSYMSPQEIIDQTPRHVTSILSTWFNIPSDFKAAARAALVSELLTNLGSGSLLLSITWKVYEQIPSWLFAEDMPIGRGGTGARSIQFVDSQLDLFRQTLSSSDLANPRSLVFHLLHDLKIAYRTLLEDAKKYISTLVSKKSTRSIRAIAPGFDHRNVDDVGPLPAGGSRERLVQTQLLFLREALDIAEAPTLPYPSPAQRQLLSNLDFYLPLRELAPSRRCVNGFRGPGIDLPFGATNGGLFSLLIFRNISFNTEALRRVPDDVRQSRFHTLAEFQAYADRLEEIFPGEDIDFFCNRQAIGSHTQIRRLRTNAGVFWKASSCCGWDVRGLNDKPMAYRAALKFVQSELKEKFNIPSFGALSQFLLVGDMCELGLVIKPTVDEMGETIHRLGTGGLRGLSLLGYLSLPSKGKPKQSTVVEAFAAFYRDIDSVLTETEKVRMKWGSITAEHSLCKIKRMVAKGFYTKPL